MKFTHIQENFMVSQLWDFKVNISETPSVLYKIDILKQNRFLAFKVQEGSKKSLFTHNIKSQQDHKTSIKIMII